MSVEVFKCHADQLIFNPLPVLALTPEGVGESELVLSAGSVLLIINPQFSHVQTRNSTTEKRYFFREVSLPLQAGGRHGLPD
jgi:hypothetical protein